MSDCLTVQEVRELLDGLDGNREVKFTNGELHECTNMNVVRSYGGEEQPVLIKNGGKNNE